MIFRMIAAKWAREAGLKPDAFEGDYTFEEILEFNKQGYNCYYFPNFPSDYSKIPLNEKGRKRPVKGSDVDTFTHCFVDLDMKDYEKGKHHYPDKQTFIDFVLAEPIKPTAIVDSGNGVHVYWKVRDLDAMSFLRLQRRLCRKYNTDPAVSTLNQLMRVPGTVNVKNEGDFKLCEVVHSDESVEYDCEQLDSMLPPVSPEDERYCKEHYDKIYMLNQDVDVKEELPAKFLKLCKKSPQVHSLFYGNPKDRSSADFRLAHLMHAGGLTAEEALSVLYNTAKACERTKVHRYNYAKNIVDKVWTFESEAAEGKKKEPLSKSVRQILEKSGTEPAGERFRSHRMIDATAHGYRLTQVMGLIGGAGNGKTTVSLNFFLWFVENNPEYIHLYVSLEQPEEEIAKIWRTMSKDNEALFDKVHVIGNYNADGTFRDLSLSDIEEYVKQIEKETGKKVGCVSIDHIGILRHEKDSEEDFQGLKATCKRMKSFAVSTNTFLIMQSQTSREKNNGGDVELDMDAAYGTSNFEWFCDWIVTTWQPLKRIYPEAPHMTVTAFKMAKIRHKDATKDDIKEGAVYAMKFEPETKTLRELTGDEHTAFEFWNARAVKIRNKDKKREPAPLKVITWTEKKVKPDERNA